MPKTPRKRRSRGNAASAAPLSPNKKLPPGDASTPISSPSPSSAPVVATTNTTSRDDRVVIATQDDSNENIESDSDVEIITPSRFPHRMSTTSNSNANDNDNQNRDGDNEIQVMSSSATNPNVDYPHMRHLCGIYPFDTNQNDADRNSNNKSFCPKCYCVICDILASECKFWEGNHCSAHDKNAQSVQSRELGFRQRGGEGAIQSPSAPTIMTPRNQQHDFTSIALQLLRSAGILAMNPVILEKVGGVIEGKEGVVDGHRHDIAGMFEGGAADETADATKAVDSGFNSHCDEILSEEEML